MPKTSTFRRCAAATTIDDACEGMADDLLDAGFELPSVYLLTGQRLRCRAARGYFQVVDGFRPGRGVIGTVVASGVTEFVPDVSARPGFLAAIPGLVAEACAPVFVDGVVVGALSVESTTTLPPDTVQVLEQAAEALGGSIRRLGGLPPPSLAQRLAHVTIDITAVSDAQEIQHRAAAAAVELSGMAGAAVVTMERPGRQDTLHVSCTAGEMAERLRAWDSSTFVVLASWVGPDTSSHYPGGHVTPPEYAFLRDAQIAALSVHPLVVASAITGYLVLVSDRPVTHSAELADCLDLLAAQTAAALSAAAVVEELSDRAERDELTGLGNRSALMAALDEALARDAAAVGVLLIDLDDFKHVNDQLGHHVGDRLLVDVAGVIRGSVRQGDIACRLGGDEFAIVLPRADASTAGNVAARILASLGELTPPAGATAGTNASIGVALSEVALRDAAESSPAELLEAADLAMYRAKQRGKGQWAPYEPALRRAPAPRNGS